jgi:hypothetical protein
MKVFKTRTAAICLIHLAVLAINSGCHKAPRAEKTAPGIPVTSEDDDAKMQKCAELVASVKKGRLGPQPRFSESMVKNALKYKLVDPFTAQYEISKPRRGVLGCGVTASPEAYWMVSVLVNAKNKFGAYAGWHKYVFTWTKGAKGMEWNPDWFDYMVTVYSLRWSKLGSEEAKERASQSLVWVD